MSIAETLEKAYQLFGPNGENWIQRIAAKDAKGYPVSPKSYYACKFCSIGAITRVTTNSKDLNEVVEFISTFATYGDIVAFNDFRTWPEVKDIWNEAIRAAKVG